MLNDELTNPIDIRGVHSLLAAPKEIQKKLEWSILTQTVSRIRSAGFAASKEALKAGVHIDAANTVEADKDEQTSSADALHKMGCTVQTKVEPNDNLRRWLQVYYTLGRNGWALDPDAISESYKYILDRELDKKVCDDEAVLKQMSKLSNVTVEAIKESLKEQKEENDKRTEKDVENAVKFVTEVTNQLASDWQDIDDEAMPAGWADVVQQANDHACKNEITNPVSRTVEGKLASLMTLRRVNVVDEPLMSTMDLEDRDTLYENSGMFDRDAFNHSDWKEKPEKVAVLPRNFA